MTEPEPARYERKPIRLRPPDGDEITDPPMYYDRQAQGISMNQWLMLRARPDDYRRVAATLIGDWWISTVWLGIDHSFGVMYGNPPVLFESMAFYEPQMQRYEGKYADRPRLETLHPELRDMHSEEMRRYCTEAEAIAGHDQFCVDIRVKLENVRMADEVLNEAIDRVKGNRDA